jgi:hypothetical protein
MTDEIKTKVCCTCKLEKPVTEFGIDKSRKDCLNNKCKCCQRTRSATWKAENPEKVKESWARYLSENADKRKASIAKYDAEHKEEKKAYSEKYRAENPEKLKARGEKYRAENPDKRKASVSKYASAHKKERNEHLKHRRKSDPLFKLAQGVRSLIRLAFTDKGYKKGTKTANIIGCSFEEFKQHLEGLFLDGMTWENQGSEWHIDHFMPLARAKTEEEIYILNHYSNLRPLWAEDNLSKNDSKPFRVVNGEIIPFLESDAEYIKNRVSKFINNLIEITEEAIYTAFLEEAAIY